MIIIPRISAQTERCCPARRYFLTMLQQVERNCLLASTSWNIWLLTVCFTADSIASATEWFRSRLRVPNLLMF